MGRALPVDNIKTHFSRPLRISLWQQTAFPPHPPVMQEKMLFQNTFNYHLRQDLSIEYLQLQGLQLFQSEAELGR